MEQRKKAMAKKSGTASKSSTKESKPTTDDAKETEPPAEEDEPKPAGDGDQKEEKEETAEAQSPVQATAPSLSQQSKARSTSFRKSSVSAPLSPGVFSPDGETAPDIYRKQVGRIEELEKENKRLAKEATDAEKRWQKAEEELADLREAEGDEKKAGGSDGED